jgi:hypothetical protein
MGKTKIVGCNYIPSPLCDECKKRFYCLTNKPAMEPLPPWGDLMTLDEFIMACKNGSFVDYDGVGRYSNGKEASVDIYVYPSDVKDRHWTHVVWFNK